jgi:DNA-binding winged helix-turn-helix (wHTH) protein
MRVHFGEFALDRDSRQLWRGQEELRLVPKAFDLLDLLLSERPRAVSKDRIRDRVWPKTFVSESTLTSLVVDLRAALGDRARTPQYVRTVHGLGYAFCGTATESAREEAPGVRRARLLRLLWGDRAIPLSEGENLLGRVDGVAAWIDAPSVSRRHARIVVSAGRATLEDLGSKNGTYVRGERLSSAAPLLDGDEIRLGRVRMTFSVLAGTASTQTDLEP